jgi:hypothetical protein
MSAWLTVYCAHSVDRVTADDLKTALNAADMHTIAEGFGVDDEAAVDEALAHLKVESATEPEGVRFRLHYAGAGKRPILVYLADGASAVEMLEELSRVKGSSVQQVREALRQTVAVVSLSLGWMQLEDMGVVLAGQVAEAFASAGDGLIRDQNGDWWAVDDGVPTLVFQPNANA